MTEETKKPTAKTAVDKPKAQPKPTVGANKLALPWPNDPQGFLSTVKAATKSADRINGNPERLKAFREAVRVLVAYADEKFERDTAKRNEAKDNAAAAKVRVAEKLRRQAEKRAEDMERAAADIRKKAGV